MAKFENLKKSNKLIKESSNALKSIADEKLAFVTMC